MLPLLEKGIFAHHILHVALNELLLHSEPGAAELDEVIEAVKELLPEMVHTPDGARLAARVIWSVDAKRRKTILRSFRDFVPKIATEEFGYIALLAILDAVDDTVLVGKCIVQPLLAELDALVDDKFGQKVLLYLVAPRSPKYLYPDALQFLALGDGNPYSKKERSARQSELVKLSLPGLLAHIANAPKEYVTEGQKSQLVAEALNSAHAADADVAAAIEAVADTAAPGALDNVDEEDARSLLTHPVGHRMAKRILAGGAGAAPLLASALHTRLAGSFSELAANNRAAFVLLALCESEACADIASRVREELVAGSKGLARVDLPGTRKLLQEIGAAKKGEGLTTPAKPRGKKRKGAQ